MPQELIDQSPTDNRMKEASESELKQRILKGIAETGYFALRSIHVTVIGKKATLQGEVETYYLKQLAGAVASAVTDIGEIDNAIVVI